MGSQATVNEPGRTQWLVGGQLEALADVMMGRFGRRKRPLGEKA